jgi:hypothetical protein
VRIDLTASVTVTAGGGGGGDNNPPAAVDDDYRMQNDERLDERAPGVLRNDVDPDGDALTAKLVSGPSNAVRFELRANGSFEYEPRRNFVGRDSFRYRVNDGRVDSENVADVVITVEDD